MCSRQMQFFFFWIFLIHSWVTLDTESITVISVSCGVTDWGPTSTKAKILVLLVNVVLKVELTAS
jgi:hypothetical protein